MSGIEVVGIVLGSIPLLISALEHYANGVDTVKSMKEYENVFLDRHSRLLLCMTRFRQSCRQLLEDLPDDTVQRLLDQRDGWDNQEVIEVLRQRLGEDYAVYRMSVRQLNKKIDLLGRKLKLSSNLTVPFVVDGDVDEKQQKEFFKKKWTRIRGGFNANKHKELVADIKDDIESLCAFTKGVNYSEAAVPGGSTSPPKYWLSLRSHTQRAYESLSSIWTQTCPSQAQFHTANLHLDVPQTLRKGKEVPEFGMSFLLEACSDQNQLLQWRDAKIVSFEVPSRRCEAIVHRRPDQKKARFHIPNITVDSDSHSSGVCRTSKRIDCLCSALGAHARSNQNCIGFITHNDWDFHLHDLSYPSQDRELVPLRDFLDRRGKANITTKQRRTLAFKLASGILQVYDTPWLTDNWSSADIHVDKHTCNLFVIQSFTPADRCVCGLPSKPSGEFDTLVVKNRALFSLTIALIELTYGAPIHAHKTPADLDDVFTPYRIADRLTKKIQEDELPRFAGVVRKCMYPSPEGDCEFSFSSEGVRKKFWREVVMPLKADWDELSS